MASKLKCERRKLAERETFKVELCDCGAVHLTIGFLRIRLDPRAYRELAGAIDEALCAMAVRNQPTIH
jgi:hypothetical protein